MKKWFDDLSTTISFEALENVRKRNLKNKIMKNWIDYYNTQLSLQALDDAKKYYLKKEKMKKHLTMQELEDLGFKLRLTYSHDQFITQRRVKGFITIETTWEMPSGKFVSQDLTIDEVNCIGFSKKELKKLDKILNKKIK